MEKNSGDIARFVQSEVDRLISKRLLLDGKVSSSFKRKIIETLTNGAQGMFRWVEMSLEALKRIKFFPDFKRALGQLPSELSGLYDIIHAQIDQTERYGRDVATQTLKWLLCAQRLLSAEELIAAIYGGDYDMPSDSDGDSESGGEQGSPTNDILRLCRNLVVFDFEQAIFRFAHQSVREYLLKRPQYLAAEQHALATKRCLDVYLAESVQGSIARKTLRQNEILKPYAEVYWLVHYKGAVQSQSQELEKMISRFTGRVQGTSLPYVQWISDIREKYGDSHGPQVNSKLNLDLDDHMGYRLAFAASRPDTILAAASAFGVLSFLKNHELSSTELSQCQVYLDERYSLLHIAAQEAHDEVVQLLLDKGVDVNVQGGECGNALQVPCSKGHIQIVQLLLDRGADINFQNEYNENPLLVASSKGYIQIVQLLLDRGADLNAQSEGYYGNALQAASWSGNIEIVQILLDRGADVNAQSGYCGNALEAAVGRNEIKIVQILLDQGADVNAQSEGHNGNVLQVASMNGNIEIVQILLDHGADVNAQSEGYCGDALQAASMNSNIEIV